MKYFRLLFTNLFRNKLRTLLTASSIGASIFLVSTLMTVLDELTSPPETPDSGLRLIVRHKISLFNTLPTSYREKIAAVDGVEAVIGSMWFGGLYNDEGTEVGLAQFASDTDEFFQVYPDMVVPDEQKQGFLQDRSGALVGSTVAERFGWRVGQTIHTGSNLFPDRRGIDDPRHLPGRRRRGRQASYFHWDYFNELMNDNGVTGTFSIRGVVHGDVVRHRRGGWTSSSRISMAPTKTETEKAFIMGFVSMLGKRAVPDQQHLPGRDLCRQPGRREHHGHVHPRACAGDRDSQDPRFSEGSGAGFVAE